MDATEGSPASEQGGDQDISPHDEPHHGWAPDVGKASETVKEANQKAWDASNADDAGSAPPGRDDQQPGDEAPEGVGESITRRGEDVVQQEGLEPGRQDTGTKGPSQRPTGTSGPETSTGVDPQDPVDDDSPYLQSP